MPWDSSSCLTWQITTPSSVQGWKQENISAFISYVFFPQRLAGSVNYSCLHINSRHCALRKQSWFGKLPLSDLRKSTGNGWRAWSSIFRNISCNRGGCGGCSGRALVHGYGKNWAQPWGNFFLLKKVTRPRYINVGGEIKSGWSGKYKQIIQWLFLVSTKP